jgi:4-amino-4-deoxy-L-arabinose transferase-like glycosyltransferase
MLHTRRAMAEGILVFAVCFAIWSFMLGNKYPWLAGIGMALAFNAKQSTAALFPVGLMAVLIPTNTKDKSFPKWLYAAIQYVSLFIIITFILNPLWWQNPISAIKSSINARQELLARQVADTQRLAPEKVLHSSSQRVAALLYNLYLAEPMFSEVGNYQAQTKAMEESYLKIPIQNLFRHPISAGILLTLSLFGFSIGLLRIIKHRNKQSRHLLLLIFATVSQGAAIIWFIPLPWQRYLMPLIPFASLWIAFGAAQIIHLFYSSIRDYQNKKGSLFRRPS